MERKTLQYLGFNKTVWTNDFIYPILCYGDILWKDYTLEVKLTPLDRSDLNGIIFRYRDGRHYYIFGLDKDNKVTLRYRDSKKDSGRMDGMNLLPEPIQQILQGNFL